MDNHEMPEPSPVKLQLLPSNRDDQFYLDAFMGAFGVKGHETIELIDLIPYRRIVSKDIFTDHKTGQFKIKKNGRSVYALYIANAIQQPDEVWIDVGGHGDRTLYCLARYFTSKEIVHIVTAFKECSLNTWVGWSGFQSDLPAYFESKRKGQRVFVRQKR